MRLRYPLRGGRVFFLRRGGKRFPRGTGRQSVHTGRGVFFFGNTQTATILARRNPPFAKKFRATERIGYQGTAIFAQPPRPLPDERARRPNAPADAPPAAKRPYPPNPSESPDRPHACRPSCPHVACSPDRPPVVPRPSVHRAVPVRSPSKPLRTAPAYPSGASAHSLDVPRTPDRPSPPFAKYANVFGAQHANNQQTQAQYPPQNGKIYPLRGRKSATTTLFFAPPIAPLNRSENNDNRRTLLIEIVAEHLSYKKNNPPFFAKK